MNALVEHVTQHVREELCRRHPRERLGLVSLGDGLYEKEAAAELVTALHAEHGYLVEVVNGLYDHPDEVACYYHRGPVTETWWRPDLDGAALETYRALRADGTEPGQARDLAVLTTGGGR